MLHLRKMATGFEGITGWETNYVGCWRIDNGQLVLAASRGPIRFWRNHPEIAHDLTQPAGYRDCMYKVWLELPFGPYRLRLVEDQCDQHWECTCPEFTTPKPLTHRPWCRHCQWGVTVNQPSRDVVEPPADLT